MPQCGSSTNEQGLRLNHIDAVPWLAGRVAEEDGFDDVFFGEKNSACYFPGRGWGVFMDNDGAPSGAASIITVIPLLSH